MDFIRFDVSLLINRESYSASKTRIWMKNAMDRKDKLIALKKDMAKILTFASEEVHVCHEAFERAVLLYEGLKLFITNRL